MALGGGTFVAQNKKLPGAYINFVSLARASAALSERGICTMPLELDWGPDDEVFTVTNEGFQKDSMRFFGYPAGHLPHLSFHEPVDHLADLCNGIRPAVIQQG